MDTRGRIEFFRPYDAFGEFSNYYMASFHLDDGYTWPSTEHAYQAYKHLDRPEWFEKIRHEKTANDARNAAKLYKRREIRGFYRNDNNYLLMKYLVEQKFTQNESLCKLLLDTGDSYLVEASPTDDYWGWGPRHDGKNKLGEILMNLRKTIRYLGANCSDARKIKFPILPEIFQTINKTKDISTKTKMSTHRTNKDKPGPTSRSSRETSPQGTQFSRHPELSLSGRTGASQQQSQQQQQQPQYQHQKMQEQWSQPMSFSQKLSQQPGTSGAQYGTTPPSAQPTGLPSKSRDAPWHPYQLTSSASSYSQTHPALVEDPYLTPQPSLTQPSHLTQQPSLTQPPPLTQRTSLTQQRPSLTQQRPSLTQHHPSLSTQQQYSTDPQLTLREPEKSKLSTSEEYPSSYTYQPGYSGLTVEHQQSYGSYFGQPKSMVEYEPYPTSSKQYSESMEPTPLEYEKQEHGTLPSRKLSESHSKSTSPSPARESASAEEYSVTESEEEEKAKKGGEQYLKTLEQKKQRVAKRKARAKKFIQSGSYRFKDVLMDTFQNLNSGDFSIYAGTAVESIVRTLCNRIDALERAD